MSKAIPVVIVQPERTKTALTSRFTAGILTALLEGWLVMLLVPVAFNQHPSYWQAVSILLIARLLFAQNLPPTLADLKGQS